jgi:hypothetical protein
VKSIRACVARLGLVAAWPAAVAACSDALDANTAVGLEVAVANSGSGSVTLVDVVDRTTADVALGSAAAPTTLAARGAVLVVPLGAADAVAVLRPPAAPLVVPLGTGSAATGAAIQDDSIAWVGLPGLDRVARVNYANGDTSSYAVGPVPRALVLPGNGRLYVVNSNAPGAAPAGLSSVSWLDLGGGGGGGVTAGGTIPLTGSNARYAVVGGDGLIYVVTSGTPGAADGRLSIVDPAVNREVAVINGLGESPGPAVYHSSGRLLIASLAEGLLEVSTARRNLERGPGQGIKPDGAGVAALVVDPRGRIYAAAPGACAAAGALHLLQVPPDYGLVETIPVGVCPSAAALLAPPPLE